jgi:hypothetical protein
MKFLYKKERKIATTRASNEELTYIRACRTYYEPNMELQKKLRHNFEPFDKEDYKWVVSGEDWYIAKHKSGQIEEVLIDKTDEVSKEEVEKIKLELGLVETTNKPNQLVKV